MADAPDSISGGVTPVWVQVPPSVLISTMYPVITAPGSTSARPHQDPAQSASNAPCAFSRSFCPPEVAQHDTCRQGHLLSTPGPPRHFFLSFLRFSIVTNYCTCRLYLLVMTKATANIVKRCDDVPQKLRFSPNAGFAIRPSSPILMRWPWSSGPAVRIRDGSGRVVLTPRTGCPTEMGMFPENIAMLPGYAGPDPRDPCPEAESSTEVSSPHTRPAPFLFTV